MRKYYRVLLPGLSVALLFVWAGMASASPSPEEAPRPKSKQEKQLLERVDAVYKLFVSAEWRKVEDFVSKDTRDLWFAQSKSKIDSYEIRDAKIAPDGKHADVTVVATFRVAQAAHQPFTMPQKSEWVSEKGKWFLRVKKPPSLTDLMKSTAVPSQPQPARSPLVFEQNPVELAVPEGQDQAMVKIPFQNVTPNAVTINDLGANCPCIKVETDKITLRPEEKGTLTITYIGSAASAPQAALSVQAILYPSNFLLDLPVVLKKEATSEPQP